MSQEPANRCGPIFIVGSGRSGTTLLYSLLTCHPDLAWISNLTDRFPQFPQLSFLSSVPLLRDLPSLRPSQEGIGTYGYCGIANDLLRRKRSSLTEDDLEPWAAARLRKEVMAHCRWMRRAGFVSKNTSNTMRIRYLHRIFPNARFIHIIRNGYAVANSLSRVEWWPDLKLWWLDKTPRQWAAAGGHPHQLCALHWKRQVEEVRAHKDRIPDTQFFECRYEDLLLDTDQVLHDLLAFCCLTSTDAFGKNIALVSLRTDNADRWRTMLDDDAKRTIERIAGSLLLKLSYQIEPGAGTQGEFHLHDLPQDDPV